ncbi:MAG: hypothetical protein KGM47_02015, partial [Acidobacteriota bacterium]|nr:hypothetical protein [Acidobacteriota bacterium]
MTKHFRISFFFRLLAVLAAVLAVLYFGAVLVIGTHWFHDLLVRRMTQKLESETGAVAEMSELEIEPMIFEVIIRGLTLRNPGPSTEPPLFSSKTLVIRINPLSVLRGRLLISWLDGEGVQMRIATRPDGSPDFPTSNAERREALRRIVNVSIRRLVLNGAGFYWNDRKIPLDLSARKVALLLSHGRGGIYAGSVSASSLNWKARGIRLPELVVASRITLSHRSIDLNYLTWRSAAGSGSGEIHLQLAHRLQGIASLSGQGNLQPLARIFGWKHLRSGSYRIMCSVAYLNGSLAVSGHVQADNLLLRNPFFSPGPLNLGSDFSGNADHVKLTNVSAYALGGAFHGVADILFRNGKPEVKIQGQVGRVALAQALNAVPAAARLERLFPVYSRINGSVEATW